MNKKGFTLIEMLVVVAVIAILSGLTLTGIGGFTSRARDTERIGDLRNIQTHLELFFNKCGHYPGPTSGTAAGCEGGASTWAELTSTLDEAVGANIPNDPIAGRDYYYAYSDGAIEYALGATLENDNNALRDVADLEDSDLTDAGLTNKTSGMECDDSELGYCIGI